MPVPRRGRRQKIPAFRITGMEFFVGDEARPTLECNECSENIAPGIGYRGSAQGLARGNRCCRNKQHGIYVCQQAQPRLEANTCEANEWSGIFYFDSASGVAIKNICSRNKGHGIFTSVGFRGPKLRGNICKDNQADLEQSRKASGCLAPAIILFLWIISTHVFRGCL